MAKQAMDMYEGRMKRLQDDEQTAATMKALYSTDFLTADAFRDRMQAVGLIAAISVVCIAFLIWATLHSQAAKNYKRWRRPFFAPHDHAKLLLIMIPLVVSFAVGTSLVSVKKEAPLFNLFAVTGLHSFTIGVFVFSYFVVGELSVALLCIFMSVCMLCYSSYLFAELFFVSVHCGLCSTVAAIYVMLLVGRQWYLTEMKQAMKLMEVEGFSALSSGGATTKDKKRWRPNVPTAEQVARRVNTK